MPVHGVFLIVATFVGFYPGVSWSFLDAESLLQLFESEKVTMTAGVPTVMMEYP
jgi:hypothetical protein